MDVFELVMPVDHNFSAYLTVAQSSIWDLKGTVDHNISKVISGISDTALTPQNAALHTSKVIHEIFLNNGEELKSSDI